jgi:predicted dehydrogenase
MIRVGLAGLGKMGVSHLAIANSQPGVVVAGACDTNSYVRDVLTKHTGLHCYPDLNTLLRREELDAVIISTPTHLHAAMVRTALERKLHVFCEKPFCLNAADGSSLIELAETQGVTNQVGYHLRFVATFAEAARIITSGALGEIHHVRAEAYGPVVLRPEGHTWRAQKRAGGGALYDYACHAIDLVNFLVGAPEAVAGVVLNSVFSRDVEDEVYCSMSFSGGATGQLAVNWSDESFRRMFVRIGVWGSNGRISVDRQEYQLYLRKQHAALPDMRKGWTVRYTTDLTSPVGYYLRGEEYSQQIEYFVESIRQRRTAGINSFRSAFDADRVVAMLRGNDQSLPPVKSTKATLLRKVLG